MKSTPSTTAGSVAPSHTIPIIHPHSWLVVAAAITLVGAGVVTLHLAGALDDVWDIAEPFIGFFIAGTASLIWLGERKETKIARLPRRLTVRFEHDGQEVYTYKRAVLLHEADARNLAQQIGRQVKLSEGSSPGDANIKFKATSITEYRPRGVERTVEGEFLVVYLCIPLDSGRDAEIFRAHAYRKRSSPASSLTLEPTP